VETVEAALVDALAEGRFGTEVARWLDRRDGLSPDAAALVHRADAAARALAARSAVQARAAADLLSAAGIGAGPEPTPERLAAVQAAVRLPAAADTVERAVRLLEVDGYRWYGRNGGDRSTSDWARLVADAPACTLIRVDGDTTRLDLVWRAGQRPAAAALDRADGSDLGVFLGTPAGLAGDILAVARPTADDLVLDVGCGDGRVLVEAARRFGCRARGIEIDPELAAAARTRVAAAGMADRIQIVEADAGAADPAALVGTGHHAATLVFLFLPPAATAGLLAPILAALPPGGRVLAHEQLAVSWPVPPTRSRLVLGDGPDAGVTVAHLFVP